MTLVDILEIRARLQVDFQALKAKRDEIDQQMMEVAKEIKELEQRLSK